MSTFQVEMRWRCSACREENLGRHKKCQNCGKKKGREAFYDTPGTETPTRADAVTDPELIRQAEAGADWECKYCRCHERRDSGECAECGSDQSDSVEHETHWDDGTSSKKGESPQPTVEASPRRYTARFMAFDWRGHWRWFAGAAGVFAVATVLWLVFRTRVVDASVTSGAWTCAIEVERYRIIAAEGFDEDRPGDAFDVLPLGTRHHHYDQVPDGFRTEHYTVQEPCGQSCTTTPVSCTSNGNGFKTCSGGGTSCSTRYCSVSKTRQVQKYRDVSVRRMWYRWKAWRWTHERTVSETGTHSKRFACPDARRVRLNASVGPGERERAAEHRTFKVTFRDTDGDEHEMAPATVGEFETLAPGRYVKLRVGITRSTEVVRE